MLAEKSKPKIQPPTQAAVPQKWKTFVSKSDKLYSYFAKNPAIDAGIQSFISQKVKKLRDVSSRGVVTPRELDLGSFDRGRFHAPRLSQFDHFHINVAGGKLYVLVYWQQIDPATKTLSLKLVSVVNHKQYESTPLANSLGKTLAGATYTPVGVIESKKLFDWLGPLPTRKLFDWLKGNE